MNPGLMDRKVIIQRATVTTDAIGGEEKTWSTYIIAWAQVISVGGDEAMRAQHQTTKRVIKIRIYYDSTVLTTDRVSYDSAYWDIINLAEIGRREMLEITAQVIE